ncbi:MAG: mobile mystery protein B [Fibrobacterota bacterium]|nr:mobile mystery protein B [Fibrobacterota bacterium]
MDLLKPDMARKQLDLSLAKLRPLAEFRRPAKGWLRAIRTGLGMTGVELARHLGVRPPRVVEMERNELEGAITLKVLERAAEAMGSSLVYALIPRAGSLEQSLKGKVKGDALGAATGGLISYFNPAEAARFLATEEIKGLKLNHISTRGELHRWERLGIEEAEAWAMARKTRDLLSEKFLRRLHLKMFHTVWKGAGALRAEDGSEGVPSGEIAGKLKTLFENAGYWAKAKVYPPDEACARFHHRLVSIRSFAFGNGRHARLLTDLVLAQVYHRPRFTWGNASTLSADEARKRYSETLRMADGREFKPLLAFVRS